MAGRDLGRALRGIAKPFRGAPKPLTVEDRLDRWARRIVEFGILDREYLEAQVGRTFDSDLEAATYYVHNDKNRGLSVSPLIEPEWMREHQRDPRMSWYDALHQEDDSLVQTGPLFDAARYVASLPEADRPASTLDALRRFLRDATSATTLPEPPGRAGDGADATWGAERERALGRARAFQAAQWRTRRRYRSAWDGPDEAGVLGALPVVADGSTVSVVMPVRDRADTVRRAIDSVVGQTYPRWELVVVDDGSTDETPAILAERAASDDRVRVLRREGSGAGAARNAGLEAATGDLVAFLDADNAWFPVHLEAAVRTLAGDASLVGTHDGVRMTGANNADDTSGPVVTFRGEDGTREDLLAGNFIDLNALVVRRDVADTAGPFDTALRRWIDWEWLLRIAARSGMPAYVPVLGVDYDNVLDQRRVSSSQPASWQEVALAPHVVDWQALEAGGPARDAGLVSIVMPVFRDWTMTRRAVASVLDAADADGDRVEVVLVDNGSPRSVSAILGAWFAHEPRVLLHREDRNRNFGLGSDIGLSLSSGAVVVMLNNDTTVSPGWLRPLVSALDAPDVLGAQPLLVYPDGTVQAAGTVFGGDKVLPWHFLADHPRYDADRALLAPDSLRFGAITAAAAAFRAADLIAWRGFDPIYANGLEDVDLCLRAGLDRPGASFVVVPSSVVVHHESRTPGRDDARIQNRRVFDERWAGRYPAADAAPRYEAAGLAYLGVAPGEPKGHRVMVRSSMPIVVRGAAAGAAAPGAAAARRWAVKVVDEDAADSDAVASLVAALRASGDDVCVDLPSSWYRRSSGLDDVTVAVPGGPEDAVFVPQPGATNLVFDGDPEAILSGGRED